MQIFCASSPFVFVPKAGVCVQPALVAVPSSLFAGKHKAMRKPQRAVTPMALCPNSVGIY